MFLRTAFKVSYKNDVDSTDSNKDLVLNAAKICSILNDVRYGQIKT